MSQDRLRGDPTIFHRFYGSPRPGNHLAAGEHPWTARGHSPAVENNTAPFIEINLALQRFGVASLADGEDDDVAGDKLFALFVVGGVETPAFVKYAGALDELEAVNLTLLADNRVGTPGGVEFDPFFFGLFDLPGESRHLLAALEADHLDLSGAAANGRAGHIHGHVASSDYDHGGISFKFEIIPLDLFKEVKRVKDPLPLYTGYLQSVAHRQPQGDKHRLVAFFLQLFHRKVTAQLHAGFEFHPLLGDLGDILIDRSVRETVERNIVTDGPAHERLPIEDGDSASLAGQVVGCSQPAGAAADNSHFPRRSGLHLRRGNLDGAVFHGKALQPANRGRLVDIVAAAFILAMVGTDGAADRGQGVARLDERQRPIKIACGDGEKVVANVLMNGTSYLTGWKNIICRFLDIMLGQE